MSDLNMNFEKLNKACKEVNETWREMMNENNPFDTISKIAKDIRDREYKELALAFTNVIGSLLRENGVVVKTSRYEFETHNETNNETDKNKYIIKKEYGVSFDGLDFTEHDKRFKDEIERLKRQIEKLASIRTRCHESARASFDLGMYGFLHIVTDDELKTTKDENDEIKAVRKELRESKDYITHLKHELEEKCSFETDRLVKLPFDALETANMLINATYKAEIPFLEKQVDRNVYDINDLEQIAEHLLVYCKHHREDVE